MAYSSLNALLGSEDKQRRRKKRRRRRERRERREAAEARATINSILGGPGVKKTSRARRSYDRRAAPVVRRRTRTRAPLTNIERMQRTPSVRIPTGLSKRAQREAARAHGTTLKDLSRVDETLRDLGEIASYFVGPGPALAGGAVRLGLGALARGAAARGAAAAGERAAAAGVSRSLTAPLKATPDDLARLAAAEAQATRAQKLAARANVLKGTTRRSPFRAGRNLGRRARGKAPLPRKPRRGLGSAEAGFVSAGGALAATGAGVGALGVGSEEETRNVARGLGYELPRAFVEDPIGFSSTSARVLRDAAVGVFPAIYEIGAATFEAAKGDPERAEKLWGMVKEDYERRYGPLLEGDFDLFRERVINDYGITPFAFDSLIVAPPAGRVLGSLARGGKLGQRAQRFATRPRPALLTEANNPQVQEIARGLFGVAGQRGLDRLRAARTGRRSARGDALAVEAGSRGAVVPLREAHGIKRRIGERTSRARQAMLREQLDQVHRGILRDAYDLLSKKQRDLAAKHTIQIGMPESPAEAVPHLAERRRQIIRAREDDVVEAFNQRAAYELADPDSGEPGPVLSRDEINDLRVDDPGGNTEAGALLLEVERDVLPPDSWDELTAIETLVDHADEIFTPELRAFAERETARMAELATTDPGFPNENALMRQREPQAEYLRQRLEGQAEFIERFGDILPGAPAVARDLRERQAAIRRNPRGEVLGAVSFERGPDEIPTDVREASARALLRRERRKAREDKEFIGEIEVTREDLELNPGRNQHEVALRKAEEQFGRGNVARVNAYPNTLRGPGGDLGRLQGGSTRSPLRGNPVRYAVYRPKDASDAVQPKQSRAERLRDQSRYDPSVESIAERTWYHGGRIRGLDESTFTPGDPNSLFGPGIYVTSKPGIARGYAQLGQGGGRGRGIPGNADGSRGPTIYKLELEPRAVVDLHAAPDERFLAALGRALDDFERGHPGARGVRAYRHRLDTAQFDSNMRAYQEIFRMVGGIESEMRYFHRYLTEQGVDAMTHRGGLRTGFKQHQVVVVTNSRILRRARSRKDLERVRERPEPPLEKVPEVNRTDAVVKDARLEKFADEVEQALNRFGVEATITKADGLYQGTAERSVHVQMDNGTLAGYDAALAWAARANNQDSAVRFRQRDDAGDRAYVIETDPERVKGASGIEARKRGEFDTERGEIEYVAIDELERFAEYDRAKVAKSGDKPEAYLDRLADDIRKRGVQSPLILHYGVRDGKLILAEGNTRLAAAKKLGLKEVPVRVARRQEATGGGGPGARAPQSAPKRVTAEDFGGHIPADLRPSEVGFTPRPDAPEAPDSPEAAVLDEHGFIGGTATEDGKLVIYAKKDELAADPNFERRVQELAAAVGKEGAEVRAMPGDVRFIGRNEYEAVIKAAEDQAREGRGGAQAAGRRGDRDVPSEKEPIEDYLDRLNREAHAAGLVESGYYPSQFPRRMAFAPFAIGGSKAIAAAKRYRGKLFRRGVEDPRISVLAVGAARNIKRKWNWNLVAQTAERNIFPWSKDKRPAEILEEAAKRGVSEQSIALVNFERLYANVDNFDPDSDLDFSGPYQDGDPMVQQFMEGRSPDEAAFIGPAQLKVLADDFRRTGKWAKNPSLREGKWSAVPAEVHKELIASHKDSLFGRMMDVAISKQSRFLLGSLNLPWLQFQIMSNALMTGIAGAGPYAMAQSVLWWRRLSDEEKRAVEPFIGDGHFANDVRQPRLGASTDNDLTNAYRALKETVGGKVIWRGGLLNRIGVRKTPGQPIQFRDLNPLDLMFRSDTAQNNFFRRAVFYKSVKREAYQRMGENMSAIGYYQMRIANMLSLGPEDKMRWLIRNRDTLEKHAQHVNDFLGDYMSFTALERRYFKRNVMFYGFLRFSLRLFFYTMPLKRPVTTGVLGNLGRMNADEIRDLLGGDQLPYALGRIYKDGGDMVMDLQRANPVMNALTQALGTDNPAGLTGLFPPLYGSIVSQMFGVEPFTGKRYTVDGETQPRDEQLSFFDPNRLEILAGQGLRMFYPYRVYEQFQNQERPTTSDTLAFSPNFKQYTDPEIVSSINQTARRFREEYPDLLDLLGEDIAPFDFRPSRDVQIARNLRRREREDRRRRDGVPSTSSGGFTYQLGGSGGLSYKLGR